MRRFLIIAISVLALDQATKFWVTSTLPLYGRIEVIPGFFTLTNVRNPGAAWGMLRSYPILLTGLAIAAMLALIFYRRRLIVDHHLQDPVLAVLLGGIMGNVVDRLRLGEVIDFLEFDLGFMVWPTFNVADSAICVGVILFLLLSVLYGPAGGANGNEELDPARQEPDRKIEDSSVDFGSAS